MACHSHASLSGLSLFPLICWGFCSKKLCTPEPYDKLEVSQKELLFALFALAFVVSTVLLWVVGGLHTAQSDDWFIYFFYFFFKGCLLLKTKTQVLKGVSLDSTVSLPLYYLNRCTFVAATLTGTPPRWFISCRFISSSRRPDWGARTEPQG